MSRLAIVGETVLVVDDTAIRLAGVSLILTNAGFKLSASSPEEAIKISLEFTGIIHLLLTDLMMPSMSGPDLAKKLGEQRKDLRVMMMTGYDGGELLVLNYGWQLINTRLVATVLSDKVNSILHSPNRSQGTDHFDTNE
jgi:two-component system, cell cycle sensor histidine kinase and response regulator CckA